MAMTTSSSMSVKPRRGVVLKNASISAPLLLGDKGLLKDGFSIRPDGLENRPTSVSLTVRHFFQLRNIPDLDRVIAASRDQVPAVGGERQAADEAGMATEAVD